MIKKIIIGVIVIFVILVIIGMTSGSNKTEKVGSSTDTNTQPTAQATQEPTSTTYKLTDEVKSGDFVFSVNSIRTDAGTGYIKPKEGSVYIIPNVTVQNNGKKETTVSTLLQMYIKDSEGNKYTPTITSDATGKVDGELLAGDKVKGDVGFEIPTTAKGLKLYFQPAWLGGSDTIVVNLGM